jgi:hypothetical protein
MAFPQRPALTLAITGTSLSSGRLSADWVPTLLNEIRTYPECKGPLFIYNLGHGGWTSLDIQNNAHFLTQLKPTHILTEGGAVNDCVDFGSGPAISPATHISNIHNFVGQWLAGIPGVDITLQTMNPVSTFQTARTALPAYYADERTTAAGLGIRLLDNNLGWPNPLPGTITNGASPFIIPPTAGFGILGGDAIFEAFGPDLVSYDGHLLSMPTANVGGDQTARSALSAPVTGKAHIEYAIPLTGFVTSLGFCISTYTLTVRLGLNAGSIGVVFTGTVMSVVVGSTSVGMTSFGVVPGDILAVEIDPVSKDVWVMKGALREGPFNYGAAIGISGTLYPAVTLTTLNQSSFCDFSNQGDGLHPVLAGGVDTYLYPNVKAWLRARMAAFWP